MRPGSCPSFSFSRGTGRRRLTPARVRSLQLLDLLVERTKETVTTAGFEPATTTTAEPASASAPPTLADESKPAPTTATDALSSTTNAASEPLPAETTAEPTKGAADGAAPNRAPAPPADAPPPPPPAPPAVPESTITASFPYPAEDLTDAVVDEVPTGVEQSADGDDERRGGDAVLGTDEEEIILGTLPADEKTDAPEDVEMAAPAPVEPAPAPAEPESQGAADAAMNDAAASVPVAAAPAAAPAAVPTPPPPTPAPKRSLSPSADAEMRSSAAEPAAKRVKAEPADLPLPANFVAGAHPPTAALYITNLRRPLPDNALIDLLENFGKLDADAGVGKGAGKEGSTTDKEGWWLSPVKSHAFAAVGPSPLPSGLSLDARADLASHPLPAVYDARGRARGVRVAARPDRLPAGGAPADAGARRRLPARARDPAPDRPGGGGLGERPPEA